MTDEPARRPVEAAPPDDPDATATAAPATPPGTADGSPPPPGPAASASPPDPPRSADPPPAGPPPSEPPPPTGPPPTGPPPPSGGFGPQGEVPFAARYGLVRPRQGRYLAGVCAAIGRATNTDPVLWRVLLAVLGFFGGIGILLYVVAWLIIPAEGDTGSPVESMLGRGRSSMSPVTVIVLAVLLAMIFAWVVTDRFSSVLLGTAVLVGGALLLNREANRRRPPAAPVTTATGPAHPSAFPGGPYAASAAQATPAAPPAPGAPPQSATAPGPAAAGPVGPPAPPMAPPAGTEPGYPPVAAAQEERRHTFSATGHLGPHGMAGTVERTYPDPTSAPPAYPSPPATGAAGGPGGGYRPPFAPYGPYGGGPTYPPPPVAPGPQPPRPPREHSPLGAATFSMIFVVIGLIAAIDLTGALPIGASAYFAGVLVTTALGLLVGAWFGRARWLIAIGLVAAIALGISTLAEASGVDRLRAGTVVWQPTTVGQLSDHYENNFGDATLDLRAVDMGTAKRDITVQVNFGRLVVLVPRDADVTAFTDVNAGDSTVFGQRWSGLHGSGREVTDLGPDGPGGGELGLYLHVNAGELEVRR